MTSGQLGSRNVSTMKSARSYGGGHAVYIYFVSVSVSGDYLMLL
jgi:hypothetical protein